MNTPSKVAARYLQAAGKTWYDIMQEAQHKYITAVGKELSRNFKDGKAKVGGFGSLEFTLEGAVFKMGFKGGGGGTLYYKGPGRQQEEVSIINHTPQSLVNRLANTAMKEWT